MGIRDRKITSAILVTRDKLIKQDWFGVFIFIVILGAFFSLSPIGRFFFTAGNLSNILLQSSVIALMAGGLTFVILTGGIDLSVASITALSSTIAGHLMVSGHLGINIELHPVAGILVAISIATLIGLFNGIVVAKLKLPAFIVTLGGLSLWRGVAFQLTSGVDTTGGMPAMISFLGGGRLFSAIPVPVILMLGYYLVAYIVLRHTKFGVYVYAIGSNASAARNVGIAIDRYRIGVYLICALSAALAGIVLIGRLDFAGGKIAEGFELLAIASVILGGTSLFGGRGNIWGSLLGALLINMIRNGLNLYGVSPFWQLIATGAIIIIAVLYDVIRKRRVESQRV